MQYLYSSSGSQVAYVKDDSIYHNSGKLIGVIKDDGQVYSSDGGYIGEIVRGLLLRRAQMGQPKIPILSGIPQTTQSNRIPGIKRVKTIVPTGYTSVLG